MSEPKPSFIENVNKIQKNLDAIVSANILFDKEVLATLEELFAIDITLIVEDFAKGNYLGNRKTDIDLSLNNLSLDELPTYKQADIILVDGTKLEIAFDNDSGGILELSSHADIRNYIVNHALYEKVLDTEMVVIEAFGDTPAMLRIRDADSKASNVERIELYVYTGTVADKKPVYFWAKTTSSLETLANRIGDIIQLGNDIDSIVALSQNLAEFISLQEEIASILAVHLKLADVVITADNIIDVNILAQSIADVKTLASKVTALNAIYINIDGILESSTNAEEATAQATIATQKASEALGSATASANSADVATARANEIKTITGQAQTLVAGQPATFSYNPADGKFTIGIPQGLKGDRGENFTVNAVGLTEVRSLYDSKKGGFSFLAIDTALIYFKLSDTVEDWSKGSPFGKGETGDTGISISSIAFLSSTHESGLVAKSGATDTYRITFSDANTSDFVVYNGLDSDITSADLLVHTAKTTNPHNVTKTQVGLENVDNTSDENKPVSTALQAGLDLKALLVGSTTQRFKVAPAVADDEAVNKKQVEELISSQSFPTATRLIFQQSAAPTGWTKETNPKYNDATLKFTTGNVTTGGSVAFSQTFKSQSIRSTVSGSVGATTLSMAQMPRHSHSLIGINSMYGSDGYGIKSGTGLISRITGYSGSSSSHTHSLSGASGSATLNLAVKYISAIIAQKA